MAPGQYADIPLGNAARERDALARRLIGPEVEYRSLSTYALLEVAG